MVQHSSIDHTGITGVGGGDADDVTFDPTGLDNTAATDVQAALEDFDAAITAAGGGGGGILGSFSAVLGADVSMPTANTYYDGPSHSCAAGTWIFWYKALVTTGGTGSGNEAAAKLWDGSTVYDESEQANGVATQPSGFPYLVTGFAIVVLGSTTTVKLSAVSTHNSATLSRDIQTGGGASSHTATRLIGIQIA